MKVLRDVGLELETTTHAVLAAHEACDRSANDGVGWERRGLLQRLVRDDVDPDDTPSDLPNAA